MTADGMSRRASVGPIWRVAVAGVLLSLVGRPAAGQTEQLVRSGIAWEVGSGWSGGGVRITSAMARTSLGAGAGRSNVDLRFGSSLLVQEATVRAVTVATVLTDSLFAGERTSFDAGISTWLEGHRVAVLGGQVAGRLAYAGGVTISMLLSRDPIWRSAGGADPLRGLRVQDLRRLPRSLTATELRVGGTFASSPGRAIALEAGGTSYSDGNQRVFAAGQFRIPLLGTETFLVDLEPNSYAETFSRSTAGFLTPGAFVALGLGLRVGLERGPISFAGTLNPHAYRYAGAWGIGADGSATSSVQLGPGRLDLAVAFLRQERHRFVQVEVGFRARVR